MRRLRTRLMVAVLAAVTIAFAGLILGFNIVLSSTLSHDANQILRARADAELSSITTRAGRVQVHEVPDDAALASDAWVFSGFRLVEGPRSTPQLYGAARAMAGGPRRRTDAPGNTRLYAVPVVSGGKRVGTIVSGVSLSPYDHTKNVALLASLILFGVLLAIVTLVARRLVTLALRPVVTMTEQAADWSEHDLDRRFGLGEPQDELTTLAATLDNLLGRVAASLRREQRFSAEMSHELRTPLAKVRAEAELSLRHERSPESYREAMRHLLAGADQMERIIDTMLAVAREEVNADRGTADADEAASRAAASCAALATSLGIELEVSARSSLRRVAGDSGLVERILVPVIENACRYGQTRVTVTAEGRNGEVVYTVTDDGPGVAAAESKTIFEPGTRGSAGRDNGAGDDGAGLGLALARRLARAARGDIEAHPDERGGVFTIVLPSA